MQSRNYWLTHHAQQRIGARRISEKALAAALTYGRVVYTRGAKIYALGRKEVDRYDQQGIDLKDHEGIQVVCLPNDVVLTAYRNRDFRGLRPRRRGRYWKQ